ncbi:MAG: hypothetical protein AAGD05_02490 [Bacteroidota bacterium]
MKIHGLLLLLFIGMPLLCRAQWLSGIATKWNDSFIEWAVFDETGEEAGSLEIRWKRRLDWSVWDYQVGEERGSIKLSFANDPSQWVIRGPDEIITARTRWINDLREWRITNNSITLIFKSRWKNNFNEWLVDDGEKYGNFAVATEWEGDPRNWQILDELDEDISLTMKMAMVFIAIYHSSPRQ